MIDPAEPWGEEAAPEVPSERMTEKTHHVLDRLPKHRIALRERMIS